MDSSASGVYRRRVDNEWALLQELAASNPGTIELLGRSEADGEILMRLVLHRSTGLLDQRGERIPITSHAATFRFPRFFPSAAIEASLEVAVFHPNVDLHTGFVCLWNRSSPGETIVEAAAVLQQIVAWELMNREADHLLQPAALEWYESAAREVLLPLEYTPIRHPESYQRQSVHGVRAPGRARRFVD